MNTWTYTHPSSHFKLIIREGEKGAMSAVISISGYDHSILRLPTSRPNLPFIEKVGFMLSALNALRLYLPPPEGMKAGKMRHVFDGATRLYDNQQTNQETV